MLKADLVTAILCLVSNVFDIGPTSRAVTRYADVAVPFVLQSGNRAMSFRVLLISNHQEAQELAMLRVAVLKSAGVEVISCDDNEQGLRLVREQHWDALVLCHSTRSCQPLIETFRAHHPCGKAIVLLETPQSQPCAKGDAYVASIEGPEALIRAVTSQFC